MRKLTPCAHSCLELVFSTRSMVINFRIFSRPLIFISVNDKHARNEVAKYTLRVHSITLSGIGIHRITVRMTSYVNCGRSGSISETLRYTISLYGYE